MLVLPAVESPALGAMGQAVKFPVVLFPTTLKVTAARADVWIARPSAATMQQRDFPMRIFHPPNSAAGQAERNGYERGRRRVPRVPESPIDDARLPIKVNVYVNIALTAGGSRKFPTS
jgi:hypothetical protein